MLDWLNTHIGADLATYLGTFVGVVGLLVALPIGKKQPDTALKDIVSVSKIKQSNVDIQNRKGQDIHVENISDKSNVKIK